MSRIDDFQLPISDILSPMKIFLARVAVIALGLAPRLASACQGCKVSAEDGADAAPNAIGVGFGMSIYFFMGMLLLIASVLGWQVFKSLRAVEAGWREQEAARDPAPAATGTPLRDRPIPGFSAPVTR